jgi:MoxR-like ATPase
MSEQGDGSKVEAAGESVRALADAYAQIRAEMAKVIVGQDDVIEQIVLCILAGGHAILEGVPGLAKTLMVRTLSQSLSLSFNRIQFTPDLMPGDIIGTEVIEENRATGTRELRFLPGPVFANVILADEINRTPPKTQAALLEAMQERQVTVGGTRHELPSPFFVLATQNPIEQEGTYPLPEAQQDRFMMKILVPYPTWDEEFAIMQQDVGEPPQPTPLLAERQIRDLQEAVLAVPAADHIVQYAIRLARRTRVGEEDEVPEFIREWVRWGIGPRACQHMMRCARARALLRGRPYVAIEDIDAVAAPVMRHRLVTTFTAASEGVTPDRVVAELIRTTPAREGPLSRDAAVQQILGPSDAR